MPTPYADTENGHLFLIGFMGSGKSRHGKVLAEKMGRQFVDLDERIGTFAGKTIAELFGQFGEDHFRHLEKEQLRKLADLPPAVIACGGGTPCFHDNMAWMNSQGITVFLDVAPRILFRRLVKGRDERPLLRGRTDAQLRNYIEATMAQRRVFYEQAQVHYWQTEEDQPVPDHLLEAWMQITGH